MFKVYAHLVDSEIVYIGYGTGNRPFEKSGRSQKWNRAVANGYTVTILEEFKTREEAHTFEQEMIGLNKPIANSKLSENLRNPFPDEFKKLFAVDSTSESGLRNIVARCHVPLGSIAGNKKYKRDGTPHGWQLMYKGKSYLVHRIIFWLEYGEVESDSVIDHIDRNPLNNKLDNLRKATYAENSHNSSIRSTNKSGEEGIYRHGAGWNLQCKKEGSKFTKYFSEWRYGSSDAAFQAALEMKKSFQEEI